MTSGGGFATGSVASAAASSVAKDTAPRRALSVSLGPSSYSRLPCDTERCTRFPHATRSTPYSRSRSRRTHSRASRARTPCACRPHRQTRAAGASRPRRAACDEGSTTRKKTRARSAERCLRVPVMVLCSPRTASGRGESRRRGERGGARWWAGSASGVWVRVYGPLC